MNVQFLLDTNTFSEPTKKRPNPNVLEKLQQHQGQVGIASVVWHEAWFGCQRLSSSRQRQNIEYYLLNVVQASIPIFPYDADCARWHAEERARLSRIGQMPPFVDGQIAAVAYCNNLILVTRNISDFIQFSDLQLENWYDDRT